MRKLAVFVIWLVLISAASATVTYVNDNNPDIELHFSTNATLTRAELDGASVSFVPGGYSDFFYHNATISDDPDHYLVLQAQDSLGRRFKNGTLTYVFHLDKTPPELASYSPRGEKVVTSGYFDIVLEFSEPVDISTLDYEMSLDGEDISVFFDQNESHVLLGEVGQEGAGKYTLTYAVSDMNGNTVRGTVSFDIITYLDIGITQPKNRYSHVSPFTIAIVTDRSARCSFLLGTGTVYQDFGLTGGTNHSQAGFKMQDGTTTTLYVRCTEEKYALTSTASFQVGMDMTPPEITLVASDVTSLSLLSNILVETNEESVCAYSSTSSEYSDMEIIDENFGTVFSIVEPVEDKKSYTYYVVCENRAGLRGAESASFVVDTSLEFDMEITAPEKYIGNLSAAIWAKTSLDAVCYYSVNDLAAITGGSGSFGTVGSSHKSEPVDFENNNNTVYVTCQLSNELGSVSNVKSRKVYADTSPPVIHRVDDTQQEEKDGVTWIHYRVLAGVNASDNETGIQHYYYMVNSTTTDYSTGWIKSRDAQEDIIKDSDGKSIDLPDGSYRVYAKVTNKVGVFSKVASSDGFTVRRDSKPGPCEDGKFAAGNETDIDCGDSCGPCDTGKSCILDSDCVSGFCMEKVCTEVSCFDGYRNGDETDTDCGGSCAKCADTKSCKLDYDCVSGECKNGVCTAVDPCENGLRDIDEADVDCGGICRNKCLDGRSCTSDSDCLNSNCEEFVCRKKVIEENPIPELNPLPGDSDGDGLPDGWEDENGLDPLDPRDANYLNNDGITYLEQYQSEQDRSGIWWLWLLLLLVLIVLILFLLFTPQGREIVEKVKSGKPDDAKKRERDSLLRAYETGKKPRPRDVRGAQSPVERRLVSQAIQNDRKDMMKGFDKKPDVVLSMKKADYEKLKELAQKKKEKLKKV